MPSLTRTDARVWTMIAVRGGVSEAFAADSEDAVRLLAVSLIAEATGETVSPTWRDINAWLATGARYLEMTFDNVRIWRAEYTAAEELGHATDMHERTK